MEQATVIDNTKELGTRNINQLFWVYALPSIVSQVIASIYNMCDRIFLGQTVGALALAGLAITFPLMNIIHAFGSLVGAGSSARMSIVLGRRDERWAEKILGNSMLLTFFFGFLFMAGGYLFMDDILVLFGASTDTIAYAREYMLIVLPGMFLTTLTFNLTGLIRTTGYPNKSMWILAGGAILNIVLDALFILVLHWGIKGAAWATTISMAASAIVSVWHFCQPKSFIRFKRHCWEPKFYIFRNILLIGISPFLMNLASSAVVALLNHQLIRYGGDLAVGACGVADAFVNLIFLLILGLCMGMQPIAGYNYGACKIDRLREVYKLNMKVCVLVATVGAVVSCAFPRTINRMFTSDEELIALCIPTLRYLSVMLPCIAITVCNSQFFQSIDKPWIAIVTSLSRQVLFLIPMMYIVPLIFIRLGGSGLIGVLAACTICDFLGCVLAMILLYTQRHIFRDGYVPTFRQPRSEAGPQK